MIACAVCGTVWWEHRDDQKTCGGECRKEYKRRYDRKLSRARRAIPEVQAYKRNWMRRYRASAPASGGPL